MSLSPSVVVDTTSKSGKNEIQATLLRQRMVKVQQREKLISIVRQNHCSEQKRDVWGAYSPIRETNTKPLPSVPESDEKSENPVQSAVKKSRDFVKNLNKITKISYDKRRKRPPISNQLRDLSILVASLDMEWNNFAAIFETTQRFRRLLSIERNPPIDEVILSGAVPYFVQYLDLNEVCKYFNVDYSASVLNPVTFIPHDPSKKSISVSNLHQLQFEATWAITNIASGTADHTRYIVELDCIPRMINLLGSENDDLRQQSVWALGNISGDSYTLRDLVLSHGAMPNVLKMITTETSDRVRRDATWTLSNLFRGKPAPPWEIVGSAIPILVSLLHNSDDDVLIDSCWAISYASDGPSDRIQTIIDAGATRRLIELLAHPNSSVQTPALRAIGNIVTGDDSQTAIVLEAGLLTQLPSLLTHAKKSIRKEVMWTLSNITAGTKDQIQMVIDAGIIPKIISILISGSESFDVTKEAYWALANSCEGGTDTQISYIIGQGVIRPFCEGINVADPKIIQVALEGILAVLNSAERQGLVGQVTSTIEECGGLDRIEALQSHENAQVYETCVTILERFFAGEEE